MGRQARQLSKSGTYHILLRGVNHCDLFEDDADFEKFIDTLMTVKLYIPFKLFAYCLMSNHVHLLLREQIEGDISIIMKRVLTHYAGWFNRKYCRSGALIANRYKSACVEEDVYLLAILRYIHQNPVKAGLISNPADYRWSSFREYIDACGEITDIALISDMFSRGRASAREEFLHFHNVASDAEYIPIEGKKKSEAQLRQEAIKILNMEPHLLTSRSKLERNAAIAKLRSRGMSIRQIERITGVSRGVVAKC
jgi:REP element-mobilizing transposase RayT